MRVIVIFLLFGLVNISNGQTPSDSVFVHKNFLGYKFFHHNTRVNFNQLPAIMNENQEAQQIIKKVKTKNTVASIFSGVGGFMIGWQLGAAIVGGEPNWNAAAIGGGLVLISIPISVKSYKQTLQAIEMYNSGLSASDKRPQLFLSGSSNGIGLKFKF